MKDAERRQTQGRRAVPLARPRIQRDAHVCRRSTAVLARGTAHPQGSASGQASWDAAGALDPLRPLQSGSGDLARGVSPARPVPAQGCTSRPGHSAGGLMPEPPGSGLQVRPRAPPSLQRPGVPPSRVLHASEDRDVTGMGTDVKRLSLFEGQNLGAIIPEHVTDMGKRKRCAFLESVLIKG
jgi:hypothetical protein